MRTSQPGRTPISCSRANDVGFAVHFDNRGGRANRKSPSGITCRKESFV